MQRFSTLDLADVYFAIGYYLRHRLEVEAYLLRQNSQAEKIKNAHKSQQQALRERLLSRKNPQDIVNQTL